MKLYRFYNMALSQHGEPFALCSAHRKAQPIPDNTVLEHIASKTAWPCHQCVHREERSDEC